jgi:hypothetical protein
MLEEIRAAGYTCPAWRILDQWTLKDLRQQFAEYPQKYPPPGTGMTPPLPALCETGRREVHELLEMS